MKLKYKIDRYTETGGYVKWIVYKKTWFGMWVKEDAIYSFDALLGYIKAKLTNPVYEGTLEQIYLQLKEKSKDE